ncbi:hypothetical protein DSO57_1000984 [Entomophthora muscae]|uniref:Uncharacterized protein n=2 Tax=Entomophthora muscae TaxID=34485 RepID=A0ACC2UJR0_9FUNG|nr:hypothetical protein DSO57_1022143 [Entomophthora muscae]KAJ9086726.1 hypothetical protein DSO57_1000984 [Entomophthora muscae]
MFKVLSGFCALQASVSCFYLTDFALARLAQLDNTKLTAASIPQNETAASKNTSAPGKPFSPPKPPPHLVKADNIGEVRMALNALGSGVEFITTNGMGRSANNITFHVGDAKLNYNNNMQVTAPHGPTNNATRPNTLNSTLPITPANKAMK